MKININAFLIKEIITFDKILKDEIKNELNKNEFEIEDGNIKYPAVLYSKFSSGKPKWTELFNNIDGFTFNEFRTNNLQALLVVSYLNRYFCITFGHARHFIKQSSIERNFGLKIALNLSKPEMIKSIDKTKIDKSPIKSRHQASQCITIESFDFDFDWEILKSITGVTVNKITKDKEIVSGSDVVSISTELNNVVDFIPLIERLYKSYNLEIYKKNYPWIDYIIPLKDPSLIETLDNMIVNKIKENSIDKIWLSIPVIIDYENFRGFTYKRAKAPVYFFELDLNRCIQEKKINLIDLSIHQLKSSKIYLLNSDDSTIDEWSIYNCLNAEVELEGLFYLLNENNWYQINKDFVSAVNEFFEKFPRSNLVLEPYINRDEPKYLKYITSKNDNLILYDRKFVKPNNSKSQIEFADILTKNNEIIHVKKYSSSSVLSHLFSQALVSVSTLINSPEIIEQINEYIDDDEFEFDFINDEFPRKHKIVIAIMQKGRNPLHMPFFSKVNFRYQAKRIYEMGFKVELLKICDY